MNEFEQPWYCSWGAIIVAFILFWPVGIALLVVRNQNSKAIIGQSNKKFYTGLGIFMIFVGLVGLSESAFMGIFFIIGGVALIRYGGKLAKIAERKRRYIDLIVNREEYGIDKMASICNVPADVVEKELEQMINVGTFKGAYIDHNMRCISLPPKKVEPAPAPVVNNVVSAQPVQSVEVSVACPGCGAIHKIIKGQVIECDYCGTPVSSN